MDSILLPFSSVVQNWGLQHRRSCIWIVEKKCNPNQQNAPKYKKLSTETSFLVKKVSYHRGCVHGGGVGCYLKMFLSGRQDEMKFLFRWWKWQVETWGNPGIYPFTLIFTMDCRASLWMVQSRSTSSLEDGGNSKPESSLPASGTEYDFLLFLAKAHSLAKWKEWGKRHRSRLIN